MVMVHLVVQAHFLEFAACVLTAVLQDIGVLLLKAVQTVVSLTTLVQKTSSRVELINLVLPVKAYFLYRGDADAMNC